MYFDERKARRTIDFIEMLKHTKGQFRGKPFELMPWQRQFVSDVFGTQRDGGVRQYSKAYLEVPKKNGKSELGAAIALNMLCNDDEVRAEVYGCASDRQQASIVFDVADDMVDQNAALRKHIRVVRSTKRMIYLPTGSVYQVLSSEVRSKHGYNVSGVVFDELHTQPNRDLYDVMTKYSGDARKQPLFVFLTTAGTDRHSICWEVHQHALDVKEGRKVDPFFYPMIYSLPSDADWTDEANWFAANPSLGVTIAIDKVREAFHEAQQNAADENIFRQLRLNQWVGSGVRWMQPAKWDECTGSFDESELEGRPCYGGLDLSSVNDLTAFVLVFPPVDDGEPYKVLPYFWIPQENIARRVRTDKVPYDVWAAGKHIQTTEGNVVHYGAIEAFISRLWERFDIKEIAVDRWNATHMIQNLDELGLNMVAFGQGFRDMSPPTKELMRLVLSHEIAHNGSPVLRWNLENVFVRTDPAGNIKIDKEKSTEKVDGAVALVMALDRAIKHAEIESVYTERGLIIL